MEGVARVTWFQLLVEFLVHFVVNWLRNFLIFLSSFEDVGICLKYGIRMNAWNFNLYTTANEDLFYFLNIII